MVSAQRSSVGRSPVAALWGPLSSGDFALVAHTGLSSSASPRAAQAFDLLPLAVAPGSAPGGPASFFGGQGFADHFFDGGQSGQDLLDAGVAQGAHAAFLGGIADLVG